MVGISIVLFRGNLSSELNLRFLLSPVEVIIKYLLLLISSKYPLTFLKISYKGFAI